MRSEEWREGEVAEQESTLDGETGEGKAVAQMRHKLYDKRTVLHRKCRVGRRLKGEWSMLGRAGWSGIGREEMGWSGFK